MRSLSSARDARPVSGSRKLHSDDEPRALRRAHCAPRSAPSTAHDTASAAQETAASNDAVVTGGICKVSASPGRS